MPQALHRHTYARERRPPQRLFVQRHHRPQTRLAINPGRDLFVPMLAHVLDMIELIDRTRRRVLLDDTSPLTCRGSHAAPPRASPWPGSPIIGLVHSLILVHLAR